MNNNSLDFLKIEIDERTTIGLFEQTLFYEKKELSGTFYEIQIPIKNIRELKFVEKHIDIEKTKNNLIGDFISTIIDSGAHPTTVEINNPEIIIRYVENEYVRWKILKIKHKLITKEIFEKIKLNVKENLNE